MVKFIYEVLEEVAKKRTKSEKVNILKQNESWALKDILRGSFDSKVVWNLPGGQPPYTPNEGHNAPTNLLRENIKFKYFVKGGPGDKLGTLKRENLFIGLIESIHPEDAKLVVDMMNKVKPKHLTRPIVQEAFPGLLKD